MQKSITFKNANISFSDVGKGTPIVLIHGFLENSTMWDKITPQLSKNNRIITVDLLGHGNSESIGYIHSMELFAESIEAVLHHLKINDYFLIGHSLGGYVALALADKNPKKIKGLCLMNSTSNEDSEERKNLRTRANKMVQNSFESLVKMSVANLFHPENLSKYKNEIEDVKVQALKTSVQGYMAANEGMKNRKNRNHILNENTFKKLIIIGKKDPVLDFEASINEAKKTNTDYVIFPDGHMSHIENTAILIDTITNFI
ncbi:alpha/beta fold hydrolase [Polaribacter sp. Asnod6-C07]|uniref:alpha/beta fold hydrolase n=1 Tax=Polaribacter sp. Asnod6-C07 TaxID=3160582 RepID=UPI00387036C5